MTDREHRSDPATRTEGETLDMPEGMQAFVKGQVLGERYQILEMLGRGGMGEVWHAFDLKLRVEVALKALRPEFFKSERRLELLRQEVRAAREVMSPNVCRIFDLIEIEGRELVSMEYVDGATLLGVLHERGPLELKEAQDIASQFLAGLEAIHKVGLIHRDIKPENIMLTRAGRVVVMDFGLAREETEGGGSVSGTPAYMAPEQAAGQTLDARADVYAAGVVLAEMVSPDGIKSFESRQSIWEGVRSEPAKVPDSPWAAVIKKAVAKEREGRFNSAHTLTRALEDVTLRVEGAEDLHPYPGLASFTEDDAEYFFGREAEVEQMWRKLEGPPRMLALVGPSGAGKTSFLQAGLIANAGSGWACLTCKPGTSPQLGLSRALAPEMTGDVDAMDLLLRFDNPEIAIEVVSRWGQRAPHAVVVVDQFEELFTQNGAEEQQRFTELLNRLVLDSDVHVLLSMRDDFLLRCHDHEALTSLFSELTPLRAPAGAALRRALVQPATKCGYRFEDDELVEEMLAEVEGERGALPLLAFAAAQIWERRDRETGLLTREAYQGIGGVGGALAQHAEATIDRVGNDRIGIVRELFRNLVTAEGTRAVREWDELLTVFDDARRAGAEEVLHELIDARLLTSYEVKEEDREPTRRVEIIHESLLANWPRLVRWQTQDQEGAQLRDELRQAARAWDEHGQHEDRLWTGTAFREYQLWRERYSGGLTDSEEAFAWAMTAFASRRRRRRRIASAAAVSILVGVLAVVTSLWQRAVLETRRAEASKLLTMGELEIDAYPTAALAWGTASLELSDTVEGRQFVLKALHLGPPVTIAEAAWENEVFIDLVMSPSGTWLASGDRGRVALRHSDGRPAVAVDNPAQPAPLTLAFASDEVLITGRSGTHRWWSASDPAAPFRVEKNRGWLRAVRGDAYFSYLGPRHQVMESLAGQRALEEGLFGMHRWPTGDGAGQFMGAMENWTCDDIDRGGGRLAYSIGNTLYLRSLVDWNRSPVLIGQHDTDIIDVEFLSEGEHVATLDASGRVSTWSTGTSAERVVQSSDRPDGLTEQVDLEYSAGKGMLALHGVNEEGRPTVWLRDTAAPNGASPVELRRSDLGYANSGQIVFQPGGDWLISSNFYSAEFWPLSRPLPWVLDHGKRVRDIAFTPDGRWLLSVTYGFGGPDRLLAWPLDGQRGGRHTVLHEEPPISFYFANLAIHPDGEMVAVGSQNGSRVLVVPLTGGAIREFTGAAELGDGGDNFFLAFSPNGRLLAAVSQKAGGIIQVWNIETGESHELGPVGGNSSSARFVSSSLRFVDDSNLIWSGNTSEGDEWRIEAVRMNVETGGKDTITSQMDGAYAHEEFFRTVSSDASLVLTAHIVDFQTLDTEAIITDLKNGEFKSLVAHGNDPVSFAFDPSGKWLVTGGLHDGLVRVGPVNGDQPHLFYGHQGWVQSVEFSPDGRWVASAGDDGTVRLWPVPDLEKPPFHTLPHDEFLDRLRALTNLRVVRDEESSTGWRVDIGPFPGWETVPTW